MRNGRFAERNKEDIREDEQLFELSSVVERVGAEDKSIVEKWARVQGETDREREPLQWTEKTMEQNLHWFARWGCPPKTGELDHGQRELDTRPHTGHEYE